MVGNRIGAGRRDEAYETVRTRDHHQRNCRMDRWRMCLLLRDVVVGLYDLSRAA